MKVSNFPKEVPNAPAIGEGSVWIGIQREEGTDFVARVDTQTNKVTARIPVNKSPWDVAVGAGSVWVTGYGGGHGTVQRIDPATNQVVATIEVDPGHPGSITASDSGVWVGVGNTGANDLVRIDPATNKVAATISVPGPITAYVESLQIVGKALWVQEIVSTQGGNSDHGGDLVHIDASTDQVVASIPVHALNMAAGPGAVWVTGRSAGNGAAGGGFVARKVNPATNAIVGDPIQRPGGYGPLLVDQAGVWLSGYDPKERVKVVHLDASSGRIDASSEPINSYYTGDAFDPSTGSFWLTAPLGSLTRLDIR